MAPVRVWGARYSVFSRMLELALREKDHPYEWHERDVFDSAADRADQESRHPWGKVPAMEHGGIALYETRACLAYLEQPEFGAVRLEPEAPRARARAEQVFSIAASYAYPAMVWEVFVEAVGRRAEGLEPDPERVAHGLGRAERALDAVEPLVGADGVLDGARPTLADIALGPVFAYFTCVGPARLLLAGRPALRDWWHGWRERPSMQATRSPLEDA